MPTSNPISDIKRAIFRGRQWLTSQGFCSAKLSKTNNIAVQIGVARGLKQRVYAKSLLAITSLSSLMKYDPKVVALLFYEINCDDKLNVIDKMVKRSVGRQVALEPKIVSSSRSDGIHVITTTRSHREYDLELAFLGEVGSALEAFAANEYQNKMDLFVRLAALVEVLAQKELSVSTEFVEHTSVVI